MICMNLVAAGAYLQTLRKAQGLSQEGLGDRIGVTGNTIYRIEAGRQAPMMEQIINLLATLKGRAEDMAHLMRNAQATENDGRTLAHERLQALAAQASNEELQTVINRLRELADQIESGKAHLPHD